MWLISVPAFFLLLLINSIPSSGQAALDLSNHDFLEKPEVNLAGDWEFYWNKLLEPGDFNASLKPVYIHVPGVWNRQGDYEALGYGTYRFQLKLPPNQIGLSVYFPIVNSSAKIWVNDIFVTETGIVNSDKDNYEPRLMGTVVPIPDGVELVALVVQVANFTYYTSGIPSTPRIGRSGAIFERNNRANGIENFFAGSLIAMCIYQLMLFFLNTHRKPYLWLAMICLGVALRALIVHGGSFLLPNLIPSIHWEVWKKIEFASVYGMLIFFPSYIYYLFPTVASKRIQQIFMAAGIILCIPVLFTPHYIYGMLLEIVHLLLLFAFAYAIYSVIIAWRRGNKDARVICFGIVASFPFILIEIIQNSVFTQYNIEFEFLVEAGVLVFLLFQVYLLGRHYARAYRRLEVSNRELERMVSDRTLELVTSNSVKDRLLSVMSHDVKSPLNSLQGILHIYNKGALQREEFDNFTKILEADLHKTSLLVENILFWTKNQIRGIEVKIEKFDLRQLLDEITGLYQTIAGNKGIQLSHNLKEETFITSDRNILYFVIRNLVANAIKFSGENTSVRMEIEIEKDRTVIKIKDQGVGMNDEILRNLCAPELISSTTGTENEKGTGLGIGLCKDYLEKIDGEIVVESLEGKGSTFTIIIDR
jgi:signal transduction histidine kinase